MITHTQRYMHLSVPSCINLAHPLVNYSHTDDGAEAQRWQ